MPPCQGAIAKAEEILATLGAEGIMLQQFSNPDNPKVQRKTMGCHGVRPH